MQNNRKKVHTQKGQSQCYLTPRSPKRSGASDSISRVLEQSSSIERTSLKNKKRKVVDEYLEYGCGFPVRLVNVPMIQEEEGEWVPEIDYNKLDKLVLIEICKSAYKLTGNHIRFIRLYFEKTLEEFARIFRVKHSSVLHWEKQKENSAKMTWGTELVVRLFVLCQIESGARKFQQDYLSLMDQEVTKNSQSEINLDMQIV